MRKRLIVVGISVILIGGIFFAYFASSTRDQNPAITLRLKWLFDPGFAGEMVADKGGIFEKHGLMVELEPGGFEADPIKLVASGSDDFGHAGADSFLFARAAGAPIVALAAGYLESPVVFYVHEDSNIQGPADFVGKRVGYQAGQDTATVYEAMLKEAGISRREVQEVPVKYDLTPFLTRDVEVWPGYAATQSYILEQKGIPFRVIKPADYGISLLGTVYFTSEHIVNNAANTVQEFVCAVIEGWSTTYADQESAIPLISSFDTEVLTPTLVRHNLQSQEKFIRPDGRQFGRYTEDDWDRTTRILSEMGLLNSDDADLGVAYSFLGKCRY